MVWRSAILFLPAWSGTIALVFAGTFPTHPAETAAATDLPPVSFTNHIAPLLVQKCLACHGSGKSKGDFQLHTFESLSRAGASSVAPVVPRHPEQSRLYQLITATNQDDRMPQKADPLPPSEIALIQRWILQGATFDGPAPNALLEQLVPPLPYPPAPEVYPRGHPVRALAFHPAHDLLAVGAYHEILLFNSLTGTLSRRIGQVAQQTHGLAFSPDGLRLAAASGTPGLVGEVKLFNPARGEATGSLLRINDVALCLAFSPDGTRLAIGGADNTIRIFLLTVDEPPRPAIAIEQHTDWIMALAFTPDGSKIISASRDKTMRVFQADTGELLTSYLEHNEPVYALALSGGGSHVWSAGRDGRVHVWLLESGKTLAELKGDHGEVNSLMSCNDRVFAGTSGRAVLEFVGGEKPKLLRTIVEHADAVTALAYDSRSRRAASATFDGRIEIWNLEDGKSALQIIASPGLTESVKTPQSAIP